MREKRKKSVWQKWIVYITHNNTYKNICEWCEQIIMKCANMQFSKIIVCGICVCMCWIPRWGRTSIIPLVNIKWIRAKWEIKKSDRIFYMLCIIASFNFPLIIFVFRFLIWSRRTGMVVKIEINVNRLKRKKYMLF